MALARLVQIAQKVPFATKMVIVIERARPLLIVRKAKFAIPMTHFAT
jgi:hypothetical protein